ncbi:L,D-transpeptidase [Kitasatospora sp. NPDC051914]|uniref:L,D-transpeptidase n=1 Tax=Kitasatospora sp. NPDC051914 TaxID=3154945 RepID=UPI003441529D
MGGGHEDMIGSALRELTAQAPAALPLPYDTVRRRGARRRRRRRAAALAAVAAVCAIGLLGSAASRPEIRQGPAAPAASGPAPAPSPTAPPSSRSVLTTVDVAAHTVRVQDGTTVLKVLPATAGRPDHPTRPGAMTVAEKLASFHVNSSTGPTLAPAAGEGEYNLTLSWCVRLVARDGYVTYICAMPWYGPSVLGRDNRTFGQIGLSSEDARWYFEQARVGDTVQVVNPGAGNP